MSLSGRLKDMRPVYSRVWGIQNLFCLWQAARHDFGDRYMSGVTVKSRFGEHPLSGVCEACRVVLFR